MKSNRAALAVPVFPVVIYNPPGLSAISYRVGDYSSFREALLENLPGEVELKGWRPTTDGDLTLQLLEWWAYVADIITFYNERIANSSYLGTAVLPTATTPPGSPSAPAPAVGSTGGTPGLPDTTALIAGVTGYQPRPGLAAVGQLAVLVNGSVPVALPPGFAVQSKPGPGQQPQVFQADASSATYLPTDSGGAVPVDLSSATFFVQGGVTTIEGASATQPGPLLKGTITSIKAGDMVVIAPLDTPFSSASAVAVTVESLVPETDPRGHTNTRLNLASLDPPTSFVTSVNGQRGVTKFQVLRSIQSVPTYAFDSQNGIAPAVSGLTPATAATASGVHLASLVRDIGVGDIVVLEVQPATSSGSVTFSAAAVTDYQEAIWYANADNPATAPQKPPASRTEVAIPIPHSFLTLDGVVPSSSGSLPTVTRVWYGYRPVSAVLDEIPLLSIPKASDIADYIVLPIGLVNPNFAIGSTVLIEGADGLGALATLSAALASGSAIHLESSSDQPLLLPLRLLFNVFSVTAGASVNNEVLGNGDATKASQSFTLAKSPLTYFKGANPSSPISSLVVKVDGVAWTELPTFLAQPADAKVFITQQDKTQKTTVTFGDGVNGARLTTGNGNVTATYRYGSGPGDPSLGGPAPGTLVTVLTPVPGLGGVRNPVAMTGGAAPSTPTQIQQSAPSSALALGLAVSPSDYEAIAAQTPSVTRSRAQIAWNSQQRRAAVTVFVEGGPDAVAAAQAALAKATDPNSAILVAPAVEVDLNIAVNVTYSRTSDPSSVESGLIAALTDPVSGVFSPSQSGIGDLLYDSQISAACLSVPGVLAIHDLTIVNIASQSVLTGSVHSPGVGSFFAVSPSNVDVTLEPSNE
jgi:hypothetical protein